MEINLMFLKKKYYIPLGKADIKKHGTDVTIVSFNKMMKVALGGCLTN
jgi:pyruvate dehydrogenase E1 component beta subunit